MQSDVAWQGPPSAECPLGPQTKDGAFPCELIWQAGVVGAKGPVEELDEEEPVDELEPLEELEPEEAPEPLALEPPTPLDALEEDASLEVLLADVAPAVATEPVCDGASQSMVVPSLHEVEVMPQSAE